MQRVIHLTSKESDIDCELSGSTQHLLVMLRRNSVASIDRDSPLHQRSGASGIPNRKVFIIRPWCS